MVKIIKKSSIWTEKAVPNICKLHSKVMQFKYENKDKQGAFMSKCSLLTFGCTDITCTGNFASGTVAEVQINFRVHVELVIEEPNCWLPLPASSDKMEYFRLL